MDFSSQRTNKSKKSWVLCGVFSHVNSHQNQFTLVLFLPCSIALSHIHCSESANGLVVNDCWKGSLRRHVLLMDQVGKKI